MQTLSQREYDLLARKFEHDSDVNYVAFADYIDPENSAPTRCNIGRYAATCRNVLQYGTFADYIDPEDSVHQSILVTVRIAPSQLMRSVSNVSGVCCGQQHPVPGFCSAVQDHARHRNR